MKKSTETEKRKPFPLKLEEGIRKSLGVISQRRDSIKNYLFRISKISLLISLISFCIAMSLYTKGLSAHLFFLRMFIYALLFGLLLRLGLEGIHWFYPSSLPDQGNKSVEGKFQLLVVFFAFLVVLVNYVDIGKPTVFYSANDIFWATTMKYVPKSYRFAVLPGLFILCLPFLAKRLYKALSYITSLVYHFLFRKIPRSILFVFWATIFTLLFWTFRSHMDLNGDAADFILSSVRGQFYFKQVLCCWLPHTVYLMLNKLIYDPRDIFMLISCFLGGIDIILIYLICRELVKNSEKSFLMFLFLISTYGIANHFFGSTSKHAIVLFFILIYILVSIKYLKGKLSIIWPGLIYGLTFITHSQTAVLAPSLGILYLLKVNRKNWLKNLCRVSIPVIILYLVVYSKLHALAFIIHPDPLATPGFWGMFTPLKRIFSVANYFKWINSFIPYSPLGLLLIMGVFLLYKNLNLKKDRILVFLSTATIFYLILSFIWYLWPSWINWDQYIEVALLYSILGFYLFQKKIKNMLIFRYCSLVLIAVSVFQTSTMVSWMHNHSNVLSVVRPECVQLKLDNKWKPIGRLDVGNKKEEKRYNYHVDKAPVIQKDFYPENPTAYIPEWKNLKYIKPIFVYPNENFIIDDGRIYREFEEFEIEVEKGKPLLLVKRSATKLGAYKAKAFINGKDVGILFSSGSEVVPEDLYVSRAFPQHQQYTNMAVHYNKAKQNTEWHYWIDIPFEIPARCINRNKVKIKFVPIDNNANSFYYFLYQT